MNKILVVPFDPPIIMLAPLGDVVTNSFVDPLTL